MVKEVKAASSKLVEERYLRKIRRKDEKKAKAFRKGPLLPPFEFDETQRDRLLKEYWNPAYNIEDFVSLSCFLAYFSVQAHCLFRCALSLRKKYS